MPDSIIISGAFTSDPNKWRALRESVKRLNAPLHMIGLGRLFPQDAVFNVLIPLIRSCPEPYVVITDAYDVVMSRWDERELIERIDASKSGVIESCEDNCWPDGEWCEKAYPVAERGIWYAINGGQCCGRREALADAVETQAYEYVATAGGSSQERYHKMKADGYPLDLDTECNIFQSMSGKSQDYIEAREGRAFNSVTKSWPMFLHFNGRAQGLTGWEERLG